jgi:phage terminase large subunit-like protein
VSTLAPVDELRALPWPVMQRCLDALEAELGPEGVAALRLELDALGNAGGFWTKPSQAWPAPDASWSTCLFYGENGTGKTWGANHLFTREILAGRAKRPRIIAATKAALEKTVLGGASGIKAWLPPLVPFLFLPSKGHEGELWINGVEVLCCSAAAPGQNIGAGTDLDFCDDPAGWVESCGEDVAARTWATAARGRREGNARCIVSTTPVFVEFIQNLLRPGRKGVYIVHTGRPEDNAGNLAPSYITDTVEVMRDDGTWLPGVGVSPFRDMNFARMRLDVCPPLVQLGVAVDPSRSVGKKACEVGIVGGGIDERDVVHARRDASAVLDDGQNGWPAVAWDVAEELQREHPGASVRFILESNTGSGKAELLRAEERARRKARGLPGNNIAEVVLVKAARDKCERAKPAAMVSAQLQVRIAPDMPELEGQLRQLTPTGKKSDRADAFVHLVRDLGGLGDEKEIRKMANEEQEEREAREQLESLAAYTDARRRARDGAKEEADTGPLKVEGAPPGDSRYAGPEERVIRRPVPLNQRRLL